MRSSLKVYLLICLALLSNAVYAEYKTVKICNDIGEWAPYFYFERTQDGSKTGKIVGATVDSLEAIFDYLGIEYVFELLPWKRCLAFVERFNKSQNYEMFSEAGVNTWRQERFLNTREPVYKRTDVFYYNTDKFPGGPDIKTVEDMAGFKLCVGAGLSFERYVKAGLDESLFDVSHKSDYIDVIRKISLGFCDIMPANLAIVEGGVRVKQFRLPNNVAYIPDITISQPFYYHYWISKTSPRAEWLRDKIDDAIRALKASGEWEQIYLKYLSKGSGL